MYIYVKEIFNFYFINIRIFISDETVLNILQDGYIYAHIKEVHTDLSITINDVKTCNSPIIVDNFSILGSTDNNVDLLILETNFIYKQKPVLNEAQSAFPLCIVNI